MSYFARFENVSGAVFRLDTRIYLNGGPHSVGDGQCIGAIVGKNPGSATSSTRGVWGPLALAGDKMLPTVRKRFTAGYALAGKRLPEEAFVRVCNLFYLCGANLSGALAALSVVATPPICATEEKLPPIVWFAWGGDEPLLNPLKMRFRKQKIRAPFFYDWNTRRVVASIPAATDFAKHPQGLLADPIVQHIAGIV